MKEIEQMPIWLIVLVAASLLLQSTYLFIDARRRGRFPWFWGLWGLIQCPLPLVVYTIVYRTNWLRKKRRREERKWKR